MLKLLKKNSEPKKRKAISAADHEHQVAETAYFLAEKRGFAPGGDLQDWFLALDMVDAGAESGSRG